MSGIHKGITRVTAAQPMPLGDFDVCIVGSGPAGLTLVTELAELTQGAVRICVLESGLVKKAAYADALRDAVAAGEGMVIKRSSRERVVGGASSTWAGASAPLDGIDMEGWPISYQDLLPYWERASRRYRFPKFASFQLSDDGSMGLPWKQMQDKLFLAAVPPQRFGLEYRAIFQRSYVQLFVDATVTKLQAERSGEDTVVRSALVRSSDGSTHEIRARVFVLAAGGLDVTRLLLVSNELDSRGLGNMHDVVGRYFMNHPKASYGTATVVGKLPSLTRYFGFLNRGESGYLGIRLKDEVQKQLGVLNSYIRLEPLYPWSNNPGVEAFLFWIKKIQVSVRALTVLSAGKTIELRSYAETGDDSSVSEVLSTESLWRRFFYSMFLIVRHGWMVLRYIRARLSKTAPLIDRIRLRTFMEMEPSRENRLVLSEEKDVFGVPLVRADYRVSRLDRKSVIALHRAFSEEMRALGFADYREVISEAKEWPIAQDASHYMGTTRMGNDPQTSVVNTRLRVHDVENLYIASSSVFPTSGCANPTYTICALSIRLADHLAKDVFQVLARQEQVPAFLSASSAAVSKKRVLVIGAGRRVQEDVLPACESLPEMLEIAGVYARRARSLTVLEKTYEVQALSGLTKEVLEKVDIVYVAVTASEAPKVVQRLKTLGASHVALVIDTPVISPRHLRFRHLFAGFASVHVAEDCAYLPWLPLIRPVCGSVTRAILDQAGYRFHGVALLKQVMESRAIQSARLVRVGVREALEMRFGQGKVGLMIEPRDYATGCMLFSGPEGSVSDNLLKHPEAQALEMIVVNERCIGFRVGDHRVMLTQRESELFGRAASFESLTAHTYDAKRVGLSRLLAEVARGQTAWSLRNGVHDVVIDTGARYFGIGVRWMAKLILKWLT